MDSYLDKYLSSGAPVIKQFNLGALTASQLEGLSITIGSISYVLSFNHASGSTVFGTSIASLAESLASAVNASKAFYGTQHSHLVPNVSAWAVSRGTYVQLVSRAPEDSFTVTSVGNVLTVSSVSSPKLSHTGQVAFTGTFAALTIFPTCSRFTIRNLSGTAVTVKLTTDTNGITINSSFEEEFLGSTTNYSIVSTNGTSTGNVEILAEI